MFFHEKIIQLPPACRVLIICFFVFLYLLCSSTYCPADQSRSVLILNSYHQGFSSTDDLVATISDVLKSEFDDIKIYIEYLDARRFFDESLSQLSLNLLRQKYGNQKPDVIIATEDNSLDFLVKYHKQLFPVTPVVFCGISEEKKTDVIDGEFFTGIVEVLDIRPTIELSLKLHPQTKRIIVLTDTSLQGRGDRHKTQAVEAFFPNIEFEYLNGEELSHDELKKSLRSNTKDSIVLLFSWMQDRFGEYLNLNESVGFVSSNSTVPVYGLTMAKLGKGIVGGKLMNGIVHGQKSAEFALRILNDEAPSSIPIIKESINPYMFDYVQLKRWRIDESLLPAESILINQPVSFYSVYKQLVWLVSVVFSILVFLLILLLVYIGLKRKMEKNLKESEEKYRTIFNSAAVSLWEYDYTGVVSIIEKLKKDGVHDIRLYANENPDVIQRIISAIKLVDVNETTLRLYGAGTKEEVLSSIGKHQLPESYQVFLNALAALMEGKQYFECETVNETLDGRIINILLRMIFPFSRKEDNMALVTVTDITDLKRLEEQLQIRERMDSLGTLAGGIAHDFNNLLAGIMGNIDILRMECENFTNDQKEYLDEAFRSSKRAAKLIREIQSLSRGAISEITSVDLYDVAHDVFTILKRTTDKLIDKRIDIQPGTFIVTGRSEQLHQVLLNLGTNSVHAIVKKGTKHGDYVRITAKDYELRVKDRTGLPDGDYIHIFFEDTGGGMSDKVKRKAFDPLFTTKDLSSQKGQGLGLAMVYNIITRYHNGYIDIETTEGKGTVFHIYLPKATTDVSSKKTENPRIEGGKETILVVDDEASIRNLTEISLKKYGYSILTAANGQEGLDVYIAHNDSVDLIILDLTMPVMSGKTFIDRLMKINPDIKIIISSGHGEQEMHKYPEAKGYLEKPFSIKELAKTTRAVLDLT